MATTLELVLLYLIAAVLGVVTFRFMKLPPMLGYLVVGVLIGPNALALAKDSAGVRHLAEFGVVFLMFVLGLEFNLPKLRSMRTLVFGLGLSQVVLTVSGEPDYTMRGFSLQRFGPDGRLQVTLQGKQLHHYPQNDRIEIEELHLTAEAPSGRPTLATARKAISNSKASEVQLMGGAQIRTRTAAGQPVEIDSEYLQLFTESERVVTDKPVRARVGPNIMRAGGLVYDHKNAQLELKPPVRAELQPQSLPR